MEQDVQFEEDRCCHLMPEQKTQKIRSCRPEMDPDLDGQMTEPHISDASSDHKAEGKKSSNSDMTEFNNSDIKIDQKDQLTEDGKSDKSTDLKGQSIYRCKKCRRIVASDEILVSHKQGKGEGFRGGRRSIEPKTPECTAIFVEPLKWMEPVQEGYLCEKLHCSGCKVKLGCFNWAGMQCSCGAWVTPAFQILKSRVDECQI